MRADSQSCRELLYKLVLFSVSTESSPERQPAACLTCSWRKDKALIDDPCEGKDNPGNRETGKGHKKPVFAQLEECQHHSGQHASGKRTYPENKLDVFSMP